MSPPDQKHALTRFEAMVHMFKGSIGPGCLSLPFAASAVGLKFLPGAMVVLMFCCVYNMFLMVAVKQALQAQPATFWVSTYGDIGHATFGRHGRTGVEFFVTLQQLGICTVYFSFASTNIQALLVDLGVNDAFTNPCKAGGALLGRLPASCRCH